MTKKTRGILFDIDGTLLDSNDKHAQCWVAAFAKFGKQVEFDVMRHQIGKGGDLLVPDLLNAREMRKFGKEMTEYRGKLWKREYMESVQPFPGVKEQLEALHERGIKLALASSANADEVDYYAGVLGVEKLLEAKTSAGDAEISKPAPDIFQAALERIGTKTKNTLVVGDTPYDVLAAHRAEMAVAAVLCGGFERELLVKAEFLFDDVGELVRKFDAIDDYFDNE